MRGYLRYTEKRKGLSSLNSKEEIEKEKI